MRKRVRERLDALGGRLARHGRHALLVAGCALVVSLFLSSAWQADNSQRALGQLQLQAERTGRLDSMLIQLLDAENAVRGYLLTGDRTLLEPYLNSLATVSYTLDDIRADPGRPRDTDQALDNLRWLVTLRMGILSDEVARGRMSTDGPRGRTASDARRYMDDIRRTIAFVKARTREEGQKSFEASLAHVERTRWIVGTLAGGAVALLIALFVVVRRQLRLREQIADLLARENIRLEGQVRARTEALSDLASYLTDVREAEKARLARELHDELGALLTAVRMDVAWISRKLDPSALAPHRERFRRLLRTLDNGIALKRRIIDDLRPPLLEELGLVAALRSLGEDFARDLAIATELDLPENDLRLPPAASLALFRIAQEALTNVRRHARATRVSLALRLDAGRVRLAIEDDGAGFDLERARDHHGLAGMRHRVQMLAGEFAVESAPGRGTRISASVPYAAGPAESADEASPQSPDSRTPSAPMAST